ncbi:hypothetical protein FLL57_05145 [Rhodopseudomonas palustris]|uniref:hypothetical protein n=1 Tax=Rhodopseudomonas palustris TaxID=1076 RepID=UPI00115DFE43|nr:hypothetical protein FLL57_05145 [Rhodopseudomonas palustris]
MAIRPGVELRMILLLVAGIAFLLAGAASIIIGVPVKEFSFGNTLILSGVVGACTGALLLGLSAVIRELRLVAAGLAVEETGSSFAGANAARTNVTRTNATRTPARAAIPPAPASEPDSDALFPGERPEPSLPPPQPLEAAAEPAGTAPWQEEVATRDRVRQRVMPPLEIKPPPPAPAEISSPPPLDAGEDAAPPKRRNLLFASSRRERERSAAGATDETGESFAGHGPVGTSRSFEEAWPRKRSAAAEEMPPVPERSGLLEPTPAPRSEEMQQVTVLKSGVVDGMAYSLYSDGSIEAQMPEGMMRFESIDELREHLEQRS